MKKSLTMTVVFYGKSLNFGESMGTVGTLKKYFKNGATYSYISRQALMYDMRRMLIEKNPIWDTKLDNAKNTIQYDPNVQIQDCPEIDLFGYMKTVKGSGSKVRRAPVRVSDGISLTPWNGDITFNNNMGLAQRSGGPASTEGLLPYQYEAHSSFYSYTITVNLDEIGIDTNESADPISQQERINRIHSFLDVVENLHRHIRGSAESLSPHFVIGGVYPTGNPIFYNLAEIETKAGRAILKVNELVTRMDGNLGDDRVADFTRIGIGATTLEIDQDQLKAQRPVSMTTVGEFFRDVKKDVETYYNEQH
jgi:CRISPR-associated protein Cst2